MSLAVRLIFGFGLAAVGVLLLIFKRQFGRIFAMGRSVGSFRISEPFNSTPGPLDEALAVVISIAVVVMGIVVLIT
jgi:hypothetical protein